MQTIIIILFLVYRYTAVGQSCFVLTFHSKCFTIILYVWSHRGNDTLHYLWGLPLWWFATCFPAAAAASGYVSSGELRGWCCWFDCGPVAVVWVQLADRWALKSGGCGWRKRSTAGFGFSGRPCPACRSAAGCGRGWASAAPWCWPEQRQAGTRCCCPGNNRTQRRMQFVFLHLAKTKHVRQSAVEDSYCVWTGNEKPRWVSSRPLWI